MADPITLPYTGPNISAPKDLNSSSNFLDTLKNIGQFTLDFATDTAKAVATGAQSQLTQKWAAQIAGTGGSGGGSQPGITYTVLPLSQFPDLAVNSPPADSALYGAVYERPVYSPDQANRTGLIPSGGLSYTRDYDVPEQTVIQPQGGFLSGIDTTTILLLLGVGLAAFLIAR